MTPELLRVNGLVTSFATDGGRIKALDGVSFTIKKGQTLGVVGESGSGKSVTSLSIMGLLPHPIGRIEAGEIVFDGMDLVKADLSTQYKIRGNRIAMIFQEPMTALNPVKKIGKQLKEVFQLHFPSMKPEEMQRRCVELLEQVGIPSPEQRLKEYPHQLSGGMRQRAMIAIALACEPDILIADEPTTALDVTIQAQILELMKDLQKKHGMAIMFITHDLGVIAELCEDVIVMYGGQVVERSSVKEAFQAPLHPYTKGLIQAIPRMDTQRKTHLDTIEGMVPSLANMPPGCRFENRCPIAQDKCKTQAPTLDEVEETEPFGAFSGTRINDMALLEVNNLVKHFPVYGGIFYRQVATVHAVDDVSFAIQPGEVLGLVGSPGAVNQRSAALLCSCINNPQVLSNSRVWNCKMQEAKNCWPPDVICR